VLADFRTLRDPYRARSEYVECLAQDIADYYGYNRELVSVPPPRDHDHVHVGDHPSPRPLSVWPVHPASRRTPRVHESPTWGAHIDLRRQNRSPPGADALD